jgi:hypothetical protein
MYELGHKAPEYAIGANRSSFAFVVRRGSRCPAVSPKRAICHPMPIGCSTSKDIGCFTTGIKFLARPPQLSLRGSCALTQGSMDRTEDASTGYDRLLVG